MSHANATPSSHSCFSGTQVGLGSTLYSRHRRKKEGGGSGTVLSAMLKCSIEEWLYRSPSSPSSFSSSLRCSYFPTVQRSTPYCLSIWRNCQFLASYFSHKTMACWSVIGGKPERKENNASNLFRCMNRRREKTEGETVNQRAGGYGTSMGYTEKPAREKRRGGLESREKVNRQTQEFIE